MGLSFLTSPLKFGTAEHRNGAYTPEVDPNTHEHKVHDRNKIDSLGCSKELSRGINDSDGHFDLVPFAVKHNIEQDKHHTEKDSCDHANFIASARCRQSTSDERELENSNHDVCNHGGEIS